MADREIAYKLIRLRTPILSGPTLSTVWSELFMDNPRRALINPIVDYVKGLRFPWLLAITVSIFLVDLLALDPIPFIDEIALALTAAVLANLKKRQGNQRAADSRLEEDRGASDVRNL